MGNTARGATTSHPELRSDDLRRAVLSIADCRSLDALGDALFSRARSAIGSVGMGFYLFDRARRLRLIASRLTPRDFLDECDREFYKAGKVNPMLDYIVSERRAVDGFGFYGAARWRHSSTYDLMRGGGFFHNIGGAFVVDGRVVGALFVATTQDSGPFDVVHVQRLDWLCRAGSLALMAMRERERLEGELSNSVAEDWRDLLLLDGDRPVPSGPGDGPRGEAAHQGELDQECPIERLPVRSRAVARLLCQGQSNKEIARRLGISVYTVQEHVQNLCRRFGAINRTDLVHHLLISSARDTTRS
jgi:DNA-binding CsgD family transcriptional regulator